MHPDTIEEIVAHNYEVASNHYSYKNLEQALDLLVKMCMGT